MSAPLDRAAILATALRVRTEPIYLADLGGTVHIRMLSARDRMRLDPAVGGHQFTAHLAFLALSDEAGRPLFTDADRESFDGLPGAAIQQIAFAALRFNRLREEDLEDDRKNFASVPITASGTA